MWLQLRGLAVSEKTYDDICKSSLSFQGRPGLVPTRVVTTAGGSRMMTDNMISVPASGQGVKAGMTSPKDVVEPANDVTVTSEKVRAFDWLYFYHN